jgi:hypothetical protein
MQNVRADSGAHLPSYSMRIAAFSQGVKQLRCEVDLLATSGAEVKDEWRCTSTAPYALLVCTGTNLTLHSVSSFCFGGVAVAQLVEALRYNPEGRGFNSRWCHWNFSLT